MSKNWISTRFRLTMGIISILISILFVAASIGMIPDTESATRFGRAKIAETIGLTSTQFVNRNDIRNLRKVLESCVTRNEHLLSAGLRDNNGRLLIEVNNHDQRWKPESEAKSNEQLFQIPISRAKRSFANVELVFAATNPGGMRGILTHPWIQLSLFLGSASFLTVGFYLSLMLRQMDSQPSVPKEVRDALDNLSEGVLLIGSHGRIVLSNSAFSEIVGMPHEKLLGKVPEEFVWLDDQNKEITEFPWQFALSDGDTIINEIMRLRLDGEEPDTLKINCTPVELEQDNGGALICFEHVSSRDQSNAKVLKSKNAANRAKRESSANKSRGIRTPIIAIIGLTKLLRREKTDTTEEHDEYLSTIQSSGSNLLELINDIQDLSKIESGKMELEAVDCSAYAVFNDVVNIFSVWATEKNISLDFAIDDKLPQVIRTDPARFRQVLANVVGNAIKFTNVGGVRISPKVVGTADGSQLLVDVVDTGIGMNQQQLSTIFDQSAQADNGVSSRFTGTGLGLTISQRVVKALGGELTARSIPGQGSVFSFAIDIGRVTGIKHDTKVQYLANADDDPSGTQTFCKPGNGADGANSGELSEHSETSNADPIIQEKPIATETKRPVPNSAPKGVCKGSTGLFSDVYGVAIQAIVSAWQRQDFTTINDVGHELKHASVAFGENGILKSIDRLLEASKNRDGNELKAALTQMSEYAAENIYEENAVSETDVDQTRELPEPAQREPIHSTLPTDEPDFREIVVEFIPSLNSKIEELKTAFLESNDETLAQVAHWVKGAAGTIGFNEFYEPALQLEKAVRDQSVEQMRALISDLESLCNAIVIPQCTATG